MRESIEKVSKSGQYPALEHFPFAEGITILGFFAVYLFEELGGLLMHRNQSKKKKKTQKDKKKAAKSFTADNSLAVVVSDLDEDHHKIKSNDQHQMKTRSQVTDDETDEEGHHNHHGHSHGPPVLDLEERSVAAAIRGFLLVFALSFHSIFEGMAIGLQPTLKDIWFLFAAVTIHELAIMFCIGLEMLASSMRVKLFVAYMVTLGLITPIGVAIGIVITEYFDDPTPSHTLTIAILQGVAAGTLLYVTFLEVLERERGKPGNGLVKLLAVFLGFVLLSAMEAFGGEFSHKVCE